MIPWVLLLLILLLIAGAIAGLSFHGRKYRDKLAIKKAFSRHDSQLLSMSSTDKTFTITTEEKWWVKHIQFKYGGRMDTIRYYEVTYHKSGTTVSSLAAVYRAPLMKPQLFFSESI